MRPQQGVRGRRDLRLLPAVLQYSSARLKDAFSDQVTEER
jgi:hypothetical protein